MLVQQWICLYSLVAAAVIEGVEESGLIQQVEKAEGEVKMEWC